LGNGTDVNAQGRSYGIALQRTAVVRILLDNGADMSALGGSFGTALQGAVRGKEACKADAGERGGCQPIRQVLWDRTIRMLLENGADINAPGRHILAKCESRCGHGNNTHGLR